MAKVKKKKGSKRPKKNPIIPRRENQYVKTRSNTVNAYREAEKDTTIQFMVDTMMLTLNDPEIMNKDVFGEKRLSIVIDGWSKKWDKYHGALEPGDERDFYREKLDQALRGIIGDKLIPFSERYEWLNE